MIEVQDVRFDLKFSQMAPNGSNLGLFKISFLFILARRAKMKRKLILKSPRFVPFNTNLAQLEGKYVIPASRINHAHFGVDQGINFTGRPL